MKKRLKEEGINNVRFYCKDIRDIGKLQLRHKFDGVVIIDVIEHISLAEGVKLMQKLKKLLKRGAKIYIITPNCKSTWLLIENILDKFTIVPKFNNEQHLAKYHEYNLSNLFEAQGFTKKYVKSFNLFSYLIPSKKVSERLLSLELQSPINFGNLLLGIFQFEG